MNEVSLCKLLQLYANTLASSSSHIVRDKLQYICLTVLRDKSVNPQMIALIESAHLNTELFEKKEHKMNENGNNNYDDYDRKDLFASYANKGDVQSLLSAMDS